MIRLRTLLGDSLAVITLAATTVALVTEDGGFRSPLLWTIPLIMLVATPMMMAEFKHVPRPARIITGLLLLGMILNVVTAGSRSGYAVAATTLYLLIASAFAAHRLMRNPWGSVIILSLVGATFLWSWQLAASAYMGSIWSDVVARWLPLSWHNQSSVLMSAPGLFLLGISLRHPNKGIAIGSGIVGSLGLSAVWLTGSRGGLIAAGLGLIALLLMIRTKGQAAKVAAGLGLAFLVTFSLLGAGSDEGTSGVADRAEPATQTAQFRFDHWRAAVGMFVDQPLTGTGLGSYGPVAPEFAPPETPLTAFAHNELVEHLGEGGLAIALPLLAGLVAVSWMGLRIMLRPGASASQAISAGAVPMFVTLATHALIDFDWAYPILVALLGISIGLIMAARQEDAPPISSTVNAGLGLATISVMTILLLASAVARYPSTFGYDRNPLSASGERAVAAELLSSDPARAADVAQEALRWNPADTTLITIETIARVQLGEASVADVMATLSPGRSRLAAYALVTDWLYETDRLEEAGTTAEELIGLVNKYAAWKPDQAALEAWETKLLVARRLQGCDGVADAVEDLIADPYVGGEIPRLDPSAFMADCAP